MVCHNTLCINPRHLSWGTQKENNLHRHQDKTCTEIFLGNAKLTIYQVWEIRRSEETDEALSARYAIGLQHTRNIRSRKAWRWLEEESPGEM